MRCPEYIPTMIELARHRISLARAIASDNALAVEAARATFGDGRYWRSIQSEARRLLNDCEQHGMSLARPYYVTTIDGWRVVVAAGVGCILSEPIGRKPAPGLLRIWRRG